MGLKRGLRRALAELVVKHDLIPVGFRWKKCASGVGRLFKDVYYMLDAEGRRKLARLMYEWGLRDAERVVEMLGIEKDLHGCALAVLAVNQVFGVKSRIVEEGEEYVVIQATSCMWRDKEGWTPEVCAAIDMYDVRLIKGICKDAEYVCTKRRSKGDPVCEVVLRLARSREALPAKQLPEA